MKVAPAFKDPNLKEAIVNTTKEQSFFSFRKIVSRRQRERGVKREDKREDKKGLKRGGDKRGNNSSSMPIEMECLQIL